MNKKVKKRFQEILLEAVNNLPIYPDSYCSDTTTIAKMVTKNHRAELIRMRILDPTIWGDSKGYYRPRYVDEGWMIQDKVLRQLNNLHKEGKVAKKMSYGGKNQGRNYTFIRWGKHARS